MNEFTELPDLASQRFGGEVLSASDEFFAPKENLLKPSKPVFIEEKFTPRGKWMDGWETRRRRSPGYDWCVIRLGLPGIIRGVVVDTSYFRGNFPSHFSLEACEFSGAAPFKDEKKRLQASSTRWVELLPQSVLEGDKRNSFAIQHSGRFTHVRLKIYPDGGVARLRVHGEVIPEKSALASRELDLAAIGNGGRILASSDEFFSAPMNLLMPGDAKNIGDGWETRRRRGPGHDWAIVQLGVAGTIRRVEVDTSHFKGNFPDSCALEACYHEGAAVQASSLAGAPWKKVLPQSKLGANRRRVFRTQLTDVGAVTHVRFNIYPDGGVSRLRIFGRAERPGDRLTGIERFNHLSRVQARKALLACCGSEKWAERMLAARPFRSTAQLLEAADKTWGALGRKDWLEAFRQHPPIGGSKADTKQSEIARQWSTDEQAAAQRAPAETLAVLAAANQAYEATFGYVFLICATGKPAEEILKSVRERLSNDPEIELQIAVEEQRKITRLRLEKLLES